MSAQEIMAELSRLKRPDLQQVDARLRELLREGDHAKTAKSWGEALLEVAGSARNLPEDFAQAHDHYLHGAPRR